MDFHDLERMFKEFMDSDTAQQLIRELGEQNKYLRLAEGESGNGMTPIYYLDGNGLRVSVESSALAAAFTKTKQEIRISEARMQSVVWAIIESDQWCCEAAFMYWLEKCTADEDGITHPDSEDAAA